MKQKKPEQTSKEQLVLYPANCRIPPKIVNQGAEIQRPAFEDSRCGPQPLDIARFYKNKNKINKINKNKKPRGGKRQQIKKNVRQLEEIVENCKSEEEKNRFSLLLKKAKNYLNRLNKKKKIK